MATSREPASRVRSRSRRPPKEEGCEYAATYAHNTSPVRKSACVHLLSLSRIASHEKPVFQRYASSSCRTRCPFVLAPICMRSVSLARESRLEERRFVVRVSPSELIREIVVNDDRRFRIARKRLRQLNSHRFHSSLLRENRRHVKR